MLSLPYQKLIKYLDERVKQQKYGTTTMTIIVQNGEPVLKSAKLVKIKRIRYKMS